MKKNIHPKYQEVLFVDTSTGAKFVCWTTLSPKKTTLHEGKEMLTSEVSITSDSHPFYKGDKGIIDTEGRIDKFNKRYSEAQLRNTKSK